MSNDEGHEVRVPVGADVVVFVIAQREDGRYSSRCPICGTPQSDPGVPPLVGWCHLHAHGHAFG